MIKFFETNGAGSKNGAVQFFISEMKAFTNNPKTTCREAFEHDVEKRAVENLNKMVKFRRIKKLCCIYFQNIFIPLQVMLKREVGKYLTQRVM